VWLDLMRMLNPLHEIRRGISKFSGNVVPVANAIERGPYQTSRSRDTGNRMTAVAPILADLNFPGDRVSSARQFASIADFLL